MNEVLMQVTSIDTGWIWTALGGIVMTLIGWLLNRSISAQDETINELEKRIDKMKEEVDRLREKSRDTAEQTNSKITDVKEVFLKEIGAISLKIAEIKRNDAK